MANKVKLSNGMSILKSALDRKIEEAKADYSENFILDNGYVFCEHCGKNPAGCPGIARSHIIGVNEAQNTGRSELAYDLQNLEHVGQKCHRDFENHGNKYREQWYIERQKGISYKEFKENYKNE